MNISQQTMRRFILGKQGLFPGRRWQGKAGVSQAIHAIESLQIDPVVVVARSHDIALWGRVADYQPEYLDQLAHQDREFFDYGNLLFYYPMRDLPYFKSVMQLSNGHYQEVIAGHSDIIDFVREALRQEGPLSSRDFKGTNRVEMYRARKDSGLALRYLWESGELMTHSRSTSFDRRYHFAEGIIPADLMREVSLEDAQNYFIQKAAREVALFSETLWTWRFRTMFPAVRSGPEARKLFQAFKEASLEPVTIADVKASHFVFKEDVPLLEVLERGDIPPEWASVASTMYDEVAFLSPLEMVSARSRAKTVFNFEYIWEIYKKPHQRRWGYYVLPILYGDQLVGRIDPKFDRKTKTLLINGFWIEEQTDPLDERFILALGKGLESFAKLHDAKAIDLTAVKQHPSMRLLKKQKRSVPWSKG